MGLGRGGTQQDMFAVPLRCRERSLAAQAVWKPSDLWQGPVRALSFGRWLQPNHATPPVGAYSVVDSVLLQQVGTCMCVCARLLCVCERTTSRAWDTRHRDTHNEHTGNG